MAETETEEKIYTGSLEVMSQLLPGLLENVSAFKVLKSKIAAAEGGRETAVTSWMELSEDARAIKLRQQIDLATKKLRELAEQNVQDETVSEEMKTKLQTEFDSLTESIRSAHKAIAMLTGTITQDPDEVKAVQDALEKIGDPTRSNRGRKPGDTGSGLPRASVNISVTGGNLTDESYKTFSEMAFKLNGEVKEIQEAFATAAGVKPEDIKTVKKAVEFKYQPNENGAVYTVRTTPKERAKSGPKPASTK